MAKKKKNRKPVNKPRSSKNLQQQLDGISQQFKQSYSKGDYQSAIRLALSAHRLIPQSATPLSDAAACAIYLEQWDKAIELAMKVLTIDNNNINILDTLAHAHGAQGNVEVASQYGGRALALRDAPFAKHAESTLPVHMTTDPNRLANGKKIIAFSLYGDSSAYNEPAVLNAELQARIYPDWQCRFYIDDTVPPTTIERLKQYDAEVIVVDDLQRRLPGTMWRFLALDDNHVGRVIFRDADSVISEREAIAVKEWEESNLPFHLIRDAGSHTELILAGLWGATAGAIENITEQMFDYITQQGDKLSPRFADQFFLRERLWGRVRKNALTHSSLFDFMNAKPLPPADVNGYKHDHIGNDEGNSNLNIQNKNPDGTLLYWSLYSKVNPYIGLDAKLTELPELRYICTYSAVQTNGQINGKIPRRYARGFDKGLTHVELSKTPPQ